MQEHEKCSGDLTGISSLNNDELYALSWHSGDWEINGHSMICENHFFEFVGKFKNDTPKIFKVRCNPFRDHFKTIRKDLRRVSLKLLVKALTQNITLIYGERICKACIDKITESTVVSKSLAEDKTPELSREASESGSSVLTPVHPAVSASIALKTLGLSPLQDKPRSLTGRICYGQRKLSEAANIIQKKNCRSLNVPLESIQPSEYKEAKWHDELMEEIKTKLPNATKEQKYHLLSLLPSIMTAIEAVSQFNISKTLFKATQNLKLQSGILPPVNFRRKSTVLDSTKELVANYFNHDDNSRQLPGKNDNIRIAKNEYVQKRILLCSLEELYENLKRLFPELKLSFSIFYKLKPKWCVHPGGPGTQNVCVCQMHEDMKLILSALNVTISYRDIIAALVCNEESRMCMLRLCSKCPTVRQIVEHLEQIIVRDENHVEEDFMDEMIEYNQWKSTDRTELVTQVCSRGELIKTAGEHFHKLIPHHFIAKRQAIDINNTKANLTPKKGVIYKDFGMNFGCLFVNEVQSYHWGKTQVTLHSQV